MPLKQNWGDAGEGFNAVIADRALGDHHNDARHVRQFLPGAQNRYFPCKPECWHGRSIVTTSKELTVIFIAVQRTIVKPTAMVDKCLLLRPCTLGTSHIGTRNGHLSSLFVLNAHKVKYL